MPGRSEFSVLVCTCCLKQGLQLPSRMQVHRGCSSNRLTLMAEVLIGSTPRPFLYHLHLYHILCSLSKPHYHYVQNSHTITLASHKKLHKNMVIKSSTIVKSLTNLRGLTAYHHSHQCASHLQGNKSQVHGKSCFSYASRNVQGR